MRRVVAWVAGIIILVACLAAANLKRDPHPVEVDWQLFRPSPPVVTIGRPSPGPIARTIATKGIVEPVRQARVIAKVSGKVAEVRVEEGSLVHQGDVLVKLDDASFRSRADLAKTRLATARTNLDIAEAHLRDIEKDPDAATMPGAATPAPNPMAGSPGPPISSPTPGPSKLDMARTSVDGWKRERRAAETANDAARADLDRATIRASIDGVVEDLAVEVDDDVIATLTTSVDLNPPSVPAGLTSAMPFGGGGAMAPPELAPLPPRPLCRLMDPTRLRVRAWVDETDVGLVIADQPARIFLPDQPVTPVLGKISRVAARGRPNGEVVSYPATIEFDDSEASGARVGMRVNVEVEVSRKETPLGVPVQAVMHRKRRDLDPVLAARSGAEEGNDAAYLKAVFVLDGNQVRLRPIETGVSDERRVEVVSGLGLDDRLVVGPFRALDTLKDGAEVRLNLDSGPPLDPERSLSSLGRRSSR